jgi:hypothetical protein
MDNIVVLLEMRKVMRITIAGGWVKDPIVGYE